MFHQALNEMGDGTLHNLLSKLNQEGYTVKSADPSLVSYEDLAEVWDLYYNNGVEAAISYLETMFGFIFDQKE